jgi:hypothetical protein
MWLRATRIFGVVSARPAARAGELCGLEAGAGGLLEAPGGFGGAGAAAQSVCVGRYQPLARGGVCRVIRLLSF